jgi:hypothetical protein
MAAFWVSCEGQALLDAYSKLGRGDRPGPSTERVIGPAVVRVETGSKTPGRASAAGSAPAS